MPKLDTKDIRSIRAFEAAFMEHVRPFAEAWGCTVHAAGGKFNTTEVTGRWTFKPKDDDHALEREAFAKNAFMFGLKPDDYGALLRHPDGTRFSLIGFDLKRRKYPIRLRPLDGGPVRVFTEAVLKYRI